MRLHPMIQRSDRLAWLGILAVTALAVAAPAEKAPPEIQTIDTPLRPGLRSVERLLLLPDGLYGVTLGEGGEIGYVHLDAAGEKAAKVDSLPDGVVEPMEIVDRDSCFTWAPTPDTAYSLSPSGKLLKHTGRGVQRKTEELGQVSGTRPFEDKRDTPAEGYQRSRVMFFDAQGNLYTAGKDGFLFRYSPTTGKLEQLQARLPAIRGREPWASLDAATAGPDRLIYGGTFDGYLFSLDLKTMTVVNLGKPLRQHRMPGLIFRNGKLYGIGGEEDGLPRTFMFDPTTRGFVLGGPVQPEIPPGHGPRSLYGFSAPAAVVDPQGRIYLGTTGRHGKLYRWNPGM